MSAAARAVGRARVPALAAPTRSFVVMPSDPPQADPLLPTRLSVCRHLDRVRLMALRALTAGRRTRPSGGDDPLLLDVERLARALVQILVNHAPRDGSPYCPACSAAGSPCPWPCATWHIGHRELYAPPDLPEATGGPTDGGRSWFNVPR